MTGGSERYRVCTPNGGRAAVAVLLLAVAGVAPWVGVAVATGGASHGHGLSTQLPEIPDPTSGTDNDTDDGSEGQTVVPSKPAPNETSVYATTGSTAGQTTQASTTDRADATTNETTGRPPAGATTAGKTTGEGTTADEQSAEGRTGKPPNSDNSENGTPGSWGDSSGSNESRAELTGPQVNRTGQPANRTGQSANRTDRPANQTNQPANRTGRPTNHTNQPANHISPPENRVDGPNGTAPPEFVDSARSDAVRVNVTVENATANETTTVNVSTSARTDSNDSFSSLDVSTTDRPENDVSFSSVNVTPTRSGTFTLNVTTDDTPISEKTPSKGLSNGTEPLAYMSVDHSIDDANISNVTFTFRVRKGRLNDSEREDVALYRFENGTWNELPTRLARTTESHYVYRVRSPGLSEFTAGKQRPQFDITNASISVTTISPGDAVEVRVRIENRGEADGTFTANLVLDDESVAHRQLTIASGGMRQTTFVRRVAEPGSYDVLVNDYRIGEVSVNATEEDSSSSASATGRTDRGTTDRDSARVDANDSTNDDSDAGVPGFGFGVGIAGVTLFVALATRRRRNR